MEFVAREGEASISAGEGGKKEKALPCLRRAKAVGPFTECTMGIEIWSDAGEFCVPILSTTSFDLRCQSV